MNIRVNTRIERAIIMSQNYNSNIKKQSDLCRNTIEFDPKTSLVFDMLWEICINTHAHTHTHTLIYRTYLGQIYMYVHIYRTYIYTYIYIYIHIYTYIYTYIYTFIYIYILHIYIYIYIYIYYQKNSMESYLSRHET